jgi:hypothetical protein
MVVFLQTLGLFALRAALGLHAEYRSSAFLLMPSTPVFLKRRAA